MEGFLDTDEVAGAIGSDRRFHGRALIPLTIDIEFEVDAESLELKGSGDDIGRALHLHEPSRIDKPQFALCAPGKTPPERLRIDRHVARHARAKKEQAVRKTSHEDVC